MMRKFQDLKVWEKAHNLVIEIYKATAGFPKQEQHMLTNHLRRATVSTHTNIAEGCGRTSKREFGNSSDPP